MSKTDQERYRDDLLRRVKALVLELEELDEAIVDYAKQDPAFWTPFDVKRTTIDLRTARMLAEGVADKLMQVGRWDEIMKPGATWDAVKKRITSSKRRT